MPGQCWDRWFYRSSGDVRWSGRERNSRSSTPPSSLPFSYPVSSLLFTGTPGTAGAFGLVGPSGASGTITPTLYQRRGPDNLGQEHTGLRDLLELSGTTEVMGLRERRGWWELVDTGRTFGEPGRWFLTSNEGVSRLVLRGERHRNTETGARRGSGACPGLKS